MGNSPGAGDDGSMPPDPVSGLDIAWIQTVEMFRGLMRGGATLQEASAIIAAFIDLQGRKAQDG